MLLNVVVVYHARGAFTGKAVAALKKRGVDTFDAEADDSAPMVTVHSFKDPDGHKLSVVASKDMDEGGAEEGKKEGGDDGGAASAAGAASGEGKKEEEEV